MIKHLPELIEKYGSLSRLANEGTENVHSLHMKAKIRSISLVDRKLRIGKRKGNVLEQTFYQCLRKVYIPANFRQVLWIGKSSSCDDKKNEQNEEEHLEETFESRWKGAVDEIVNNTSASSYKEYLETFLHLSKESIGH
jgi:hypothetical protein